MPGRFDNPLQFDLKTLVAVVVLFAIAFAIPRPGPFAVSICLTFALIAAQTSKGRLRTSAQRRIIAGGCIGGASFGLTFLVLFPQFREFAGWIIIPGTLVLTSFVGSVAGLVTVIALELCGRFDRD